MYTLAVSINAETPIVAGGETLHTLNTLLTCSIDPAAAASVQRITLTVGGSTLPVPGVDAQHVRWLDERVLHEGDTVTIALRDDVLPDAPALHLPVASREESEHFIFDNCKRAYFAMRAQYETPQP